MPQALTGEYLSLLIALQEKPLASVDELAKTVGASKNIVEERIKELQGFAAKEEKSQWITGKKYFVVKPVLNYWSLGLDTVDVILETGNLLAVKRVEEIAEKHPYTAYRARCYGHNNGVFLQFRTPFGTADLIEQLVVRLVEEGSVRGYNFLARGDNPSVYTPMSLDGWDPESMTWKFDWEGWFESTPSKSLDFVKRGQKNRALEWLSKIDVHIIRELQRGARRTDIEIIDALKKEGINFTSKSFNTRYEIIRKDCVLDYRLNFYPEAFDIHNNVIIFGKGSEEYILKLRSKLDSNPIPFNSTLRIQGNNLFWFIRIQPSHLSPLMSNLYSNLSEMHVSIIDYKHTLLYYLWPEALDEEAKQWTRDKKFMLDDVLA
jgi:hypothetical protein